MLTAEEIENRKEQCRSSMPHPHDGVWYEDLIDELARCQMEDDIVYVYGRSMDEIKSIINFARENGYRGT